MQKYTNIHDISPVMAVFLASDYYDFVPSEKSISVTTLLNSPREIILTSRLLSGEEKLTDISTLLASRLGTAIHTAVEKAWVENYRTAMASLGYKQALIDMFRINPETVEPNTYPVWLELRTSKKIAGWNISGSCDLIIDEGVRDIKSTGIFAYTTGSMNTKYRLQLSMYRWLNPDKIKKDLGHIEYVFKDWSKLEASYKAGYPLLPVLSQPIPLLSEPKTELYIKDKIAIVEKHWDDPQEEIPLCTAEETWSANPAWQYFGKLDAKKASKNFPTKDNPNAKADANNWLASKGKGYVAFNPGKAKRCAEYCGVASICSQYKDMKANNLA